MYAQSEQRMSARQFLIFGDECDITREWLQSVCAWTAVYFQSSNPTGIISRRSIKMTPPVVLWRTVDGQLVDEKIEGFFISCVVRFFKSIFAKRGIVWRNLISQVHAIRYSRTFAALLNGNVILESYFSNNRVRSLSFYLPVFLIFNIGLVKSTQREIKMCIIFDLFVKI